MKKKRILLVDDSQHQIDAALEQLSDEYDVVVAPTYKEARYLLSGEIDFVEATAIVEHSKNNGYYDKVKWVHGLCETYDRFQQKEGAIKFDIVLTDCFMPADKDGQGEPMKFANKLVPAGLVIAILALQRKVETIIIVSDADHHSHPIAWLMDSIKGEGQISCGCESNNVGGEWIKDWKKALDQFTS